MQIGRNIMKQTIFISIAAAAFLFMGCDSKAPQEETKSTQVAPQVEQEVQTQTPQKEQEVVADTVIDESEAPMEQRVEEVIEEVEQSATQAAKKAEEAIKQKSGKELYISCIACHGADGSRPALGVSQPIKGWEVEKTIQALQGYKDGTYGGRLKATMIGQVANLSDEDIQKLAEYINGL